MKDAQHRVLVRVRRRGILYVRGALYACIEGIFIREYRKESR